MSRQQQTQVFRLFSQNQLKILNSSTITSSQSQPIITNSQLTIPIQRLKHVYLQQETTYGRFVPFLLLKDKLKSQMDSTGHTALHHMCSHNSDYLPLYLTTVKKHDPILNRPTKLGHTPLDIAGIYCRRQYVDLLLQKGANDQGNVDHWAIQGGNIYNWSGKVDPTKKHLAHWAAYNDMPDVLMQFYKQGTNINDKDGNDLAPIDLAVINKSYKSFKLLVELGFRPKDQIIKICDSKSIHNVLTNANQPSNIKQRKQIFKLAFIPLFCLLSFILMNISLEQSGFQSVYLSIIIILVIWLILNFMKVNIEPVYPNTRRTQFYSDIIRKQVNLKSNHLLYVLLNISTFITGFTTLTICRTTSYLIAILYFIVIYITIVYLINTLILFYGIMKNLTHEQLFNSDRCKYLWSKIHYIAQKKILIRKYNNVMDRNLMENVKNYLSKSTN